MTRACIWPACRQSQCTRRCSDPESVPPPRKAGEWAFAWGPLSIVKVGRVWSLDLWRFGLFGVGRLVRCRWLRAGQPDTSDIAEADEAWFAKARWRDRRP